MIFDSVKTKIKGAISVEDFSRYIAPLSYIENESKLDHVIITAPNPYIASWVQTKFSDHIANLFEKETGVRPDIIVHGKHSAKSSVQIAEVISRENKNSVRTMLNPSYTFDTFVVGSSNHFAFTVAKAVSDKPGEVYNPVFIHGGVGIGKTHLLQAIGNELAKKDKRVIYSSSEQFTNDFLYSLNTKTSDRFREKYRNCDLLLIDDIQFFSGKEATQEAFFHTFNELHNQGKQIVLTADKNPKQIAGLEERLKSRFLWGQIADIQRPELETKIAIIKKKCEIDMIRIDDEIIHFIASHLDENIREIEGALIKIRGYANMLGQAITIDFVKDTLKDYIKEKRENITISEIINIVCKELNCKPSEVCSKSRIKQVANARKIVIFLTRKLTQSSMPNIAEHFGMKDHSAVSHSLKTIDKEIENDSQLRLQIDEFINIITAAH
ncbi:chromosomal replication initiator protein DnaA [Campylobacterota bacterium]|nr:chromosomal replication initiator protein DnaA [Campylobacterota bacterium]